MPKIFIPKKDCVHHFSPWISHNENLYKFRVCQNVECKHKQYVIRPGVYRFWRARKLIRKSRKQGVKFLIPIGTKSMYLGGPRGHIFETIGDNEPHYLAEFNRESMLKIIDQLAKIIRCMCFRHNGDPRYVTMKPEVKYMLESVMESQ